MEESTSGMKQYQQQKQLDKRSSAELKSDDEKTPFAGETSNGGDLSQTKSVCLTVADADIMPTITVIPPKKNKIGVIEKS